MTGSQSTTDSSSDSAKDSDISQAEIQAFHDLCNEAESFLSESLDTEVPTPHHDEHGFPPAHIHTPLKPRLDGWHTVKEYLGELAEFCEQQNSDAASEEAIAAN